MKPDLEKKKVLLVESSATFLFLMEEKLKADRGLIVAGKSSSGPDAILKAREIRPDVIVVDLEMPFMSGLETIEHLMASYPTPMLATTRRSIEDIKEPLEKGALEVIKKSEIEKCTPADFSQKIRFLTSVTVFARVSRYSSKESTPLPKTSMECPCHSQKIITIASSTGGPRAISEILRKLPEDTPFPIVIAQHMPEGFTEGMVRWMNTLSKLSIKVGETGDRLKEGMVYFSPAEKHMIIDEAKCITLELQKNSDIYHPSCNKLLNSAARMYGKNTIAVILTGMGDDGVEGMKTVKDLGGVTIAQDEGSSSLFGMPKEAIATGCIDKVIPLDEIADELRKHFVKQP